MSNERRHLRYLITSALLVGPALGCGSTDPEPNTVAPPESQPMEDPTGNPLGPEPEAENVAVEEEPPEVMPTANTPARPTSPVAERRPNVNTRQETTQVRPEPEPDEEEPTVNERPE
ncbi:MAG: hypothetical protein AB8H86_01175 [Polyangiales bacterium]